MKGDRFPWNKLYSAFQEGYEWGELWGRIFVLYQQPSERG